MSKKDQLVEYRYAVDPVQNDLFDAVLDKDLKKVDRALESGANPNQKDSRGVWPLIMAINPQDYFKPLFEALVEVTDQNMRTSSGRSAIQYAIQQKNREAYHILRQAGHSMDIFWMEKMEGGGARVDGKVYEYVPDDWRKDGEKYKESPQQWELKKVLEKLEQATRMSDITALQRRAQELVKALHVLGLSPDGFQEVAWLQWTRNPSVITALIRHNAGVDRVWYNDFNALGRAVCEDDVRRAKYLIEVGAKRVAHPKSTRMSPEMMDLLNENKILY